MERRDGLDNIDLDQAASLLAPHRSAFAARGLTVAPLTWMDLGAPWPAPLETDRSRIGRPRSIGVHLTGAGEAEGQIVLYAGGWADADYVLPGSDVIITEYVEVDDAAEFEALFRRVCESLLEAAAE
ncbi:hypothetical protein [Actinoplanes sp. NPDC049681]|uniref:hypothetical protein n=1 Tax=Actinoplanes sp. NPDC049681 TaxID=3363905 RepID=UPI00378E73B8